MGVWPGNLLAFIRQAARRDILEAVGVFTRFAY
jgi:hypothetical protein